MNEAGDKYQPNPENLKLVKDLARSIKRNELNGDVRQSSGGHGIPLPAGSEINLLQSDPHAEVTIRFYIGEKGSMGAYPMDPNDYGMGMDTMWFAYETLKVSPEGIVTKEVQGWPNKEDGYSYKMINRETTPPVVVYNEEESRKIIRELQLVADAGIGLLATGDLLTVKRQNEIRDEQRAERERIRNQQ